MALERYDRIVETTTTTGTGTYDLDGAKAGFQAFVDRVTTGATVEYCCTDGTDFEIGIGTFTDATPDTMARTTILASTNADAAVNWGAGSKDIFLTLPASRMVPGSNTELAYFSADGVLDGNANLTFGGTNEGLKIAVPAATDVGQIIELAATPTANAFEVNSNGGSGGDLLKVEADGDLIGASQLQFTSNGVGVIHKIGVWNFERNGGVDRIQAAGNVEIDQTGSYNFAIHSAGTLRLGQIWSGTADGNVVIGGTSYVTYAGNDVTNASPSGGTIQATGGSGTDISAANLTLAGGQGTGTGAGGSVIVQHAPAGTTGSSLNSLVTSAEFGDNSFGVANTAEGGTGRLALKSSHESHTLSLAATSDTTTISIPSGARLVAVQMNVDTAVTDDAGDDTWSAAFITGSTTTIVTGAAAAQNTKVNFIVPDETTTATTEIRFTPNGGNFSAGVIEVVAYYEELTSMANA